MRQSTNKLGGRLVGAATAATLALAGAVSTSTPASAAGSFAVVSEATGVGGPQTAGTLLRLTTNSLVSDDIDYAEPWSTAPASGLRVRTSRCNTTPQDLPIAQARVPGVGGGYDVVVFYPGGTDTGYGTCSFRGLVTLTLTPATAYPGTGTRTQLVTIRS